ncbi:MAG: ABC transporter ATP-binding protein [Gemmatimonadetes bacterium]|nr:ABC transporter ATP-binding protein [Gemmatimonadota bacterium]
MSPETIVPAAPLIVLRNAGKRYPTADGSFTALSGVNLTIGRGEFVVVVGASGSGKSTLLSLVAGIDRPSEGEVVIAGTAVHALSERAISAWRGRAVGIVFQFFQLLPTLTAAENVMLPMDFCGTWVARERRERAMALLDSLGVADQGDKLPSRLSGGQQQRVAIARALANDPPVLLADEPTGNLDSRTADAILDLFARIVGDGRTLILATHASSALRHATRAITIRDGRVDESAEQALHV